MNKKVLLMILDGWGKSPNPKVSAIDNAKTPFIDSMYKNYPNAELCTYGINVGLPKGQMGNSEVGHMNIGAGRIVYQDLAKINLAIENHTLEHEKVFVKGLKYARDNNKSVHFLGLLSDGGVHSHFSHLQELIKITEMYGISKSYVHAFTDGRDVDPHSGKKYVSKLQEFLKEKNTRLASVIGRYYAMDRDKRWERIKLAYDLLTKGKGLETKEIESSIQKSYDNDITDEFLQPHVVMQGSTPVATIEEDDVVIFFNFRSDRARQLTQVLSQENMTTYEMKTLPLHYITMTNYNKAFKGIRVIYDNEDIKDTLGEVLAKVGKKQIRIAETEKYPHVTFFFNGGKEEVFEGEQRLLCPSPKVATYDLKPEMSAYDIQNAIIPELEKGEVDFVCLNFANPDMVGHTGIMPAAIRACETIDQCVEQVVQKASEKDYTSIIIADHGNCDTMINPDGSPNTAHTMNPVPIIIVDKHIKNVRNGLLGDLAPTILKVMGVSKPKAMTQESLV